MASLAEFKTAGRISQRTMEGVDVISSNTQLISYYLIGRIFCGMAQIDKSLYIYIYIYKHPFLKNVANIYIYIYIYIYIAIGENSREYTFIPISDYSLIRGFYPPNKIP